MNVVALDNLFPQRGYSLPMPRVCSAMPIPEDGHEFVIPQWLGFLGRHPDQEAHEADTIPMTPDNWDKLCNVVASVSPEYYQPDPEGLDIWDLIGPKSRGRGDCEDIALTRRSILHLQGFPLGAMVPTVCQLADGTGHLVLRVRTDSGDLIIDNKTNNILPWEDVPYQWLSSYLTGKQWVRITSPPLPVGAASAEAH